MLQALFLVALLAFAPWASATITAAGPTVAAVQNGFTVGYASNGVAVANATRTYAAGAAGEGLIRDMFNVSTRAGRAAVVAEATVTRSAALAGAARIASAMTPLGVAVVAAPLLFDLMTDARVFPGVPGQSVSADAGQTPMQRLQLCKVVNDVALYCGVQGWLGYMAQVYPRGFRAVGEVSEDVANGRLIGQAEYLHVTGQWLSYASGNIVESGLQGVQRPYCPEYVETATGQTVPEGPVPDSGSCPSGRYTAKSLAEAQALLDAAAARRADFATQDLVRDVHKAGGSVESADAPAPRLSGVPAVSSPPQTVTTTNPDGSTSTQTGVRTVTLDYAPGRVNTSERTQTSVVVTAPDGTTTPGPVSEADTTPTETPGLCDLFPDILACIKVGTTPGDPVPTATRDVSWQPEALGLPAGCPAPIPLPRGESLSFASACSTAEAIRPLVLAVAAFSALMICVAAIRGAS